MDVVLLLRHPVSLTAEIFCLEAVKWYIFVTSSRSLHPNVIIVSKFKTVIKWLKGQLWLRCLRLLCWRYTENLFLRQPGPHVSLLHRRRGLVLQKSAGPPPTPKRARLLMQRAEVAELDTMNWAPPPLSPPHFHVCSNSKRCWRCGRAPWGLKEGLCPSRGWQNHLSNGKGDAFMAPGQVICV